MLSGKVILIMGGSSGIGLACAHRLAAEGASVGILSRSEDALQNAAQMLLPLATRVAWHAADVGDTHAVQTGVEALRMQLGSIDGLIVCAGEEGPVGPLVDCDIAAWMATLDIHVGGFVRCCQAVLPEMIVRGSGKILACSGGGASTPRPVLSAYASAKAALVRCVETLALEVMLHGVQVNAIAPGAALTPMTRRLLTRGGEVAAEIHNALTLQHARSGETSDRAARLAAFLMSDRSGTLTGRLLAAHYDPWQSWTPAIGDLLNGTAWYTLRRIDPETVRLLQPLPQASEQENSACE